MSNKNLNDQNLDDFDYGENAEHFDVHSFSQRDIPNLKERTKIFSSEVRKIISRGFVFRKVHGKVGKKTLIEDNRSGEVKELFMLGSNNYLDLAGEKEIQDKVIKAVLDFGTGCGGPALLNGYTTLHRKLELKLAEIKGTEDSILFSSGYSTNIGWTTGLLGKKDLLIYDFQNHGSLYDGMRMGDFEAIPFPHNDVVTLESRLKKAKEKQTYDNIIVCVEGVYSMDGDLSPLDKIYEVCKKYDVMLAIDDAHGSGVMGYAGHGTQNHFKLDGKIDIIMGTFSKAYTTTGGFVAASRDIVDYLRINGNSYIYSASLTPAVVATVLGCIEFLEKNPSRVEALHANTKYFVKHLNQLGFKTKSDSAIIPIMISKDISMRDLVYRFHQEGIFVNGIEYPSVPKNRQRLRLSMMATFSIEELNFMLSKFELIGKEFKLI